MWRVVQIRNVAYYGDSRFDLLSAKVKMRQLSSIVRATLVQFFTIDSIDPISLLIKEINEIATIRSIANNERTRVIMPVTYAVYVIRISIYIHVQFIYMYTQHVYAHAYV